MLNNIVFVATGDVYNNQCVFAILTLINVYDKKIPKHFKVVVYTDQGEQYNFLEETVDIKIILVNEQKIKDWLGDTNFMLKIKLQVVYDFLSNHKGNMLFVDTDIIFTKKVDGIFESIARGNFYMHIFEFKAGSKIAGLEGPENKSYFNRKIILNSGSVIEIFRDTEMWNSGVIGLPQNTELIINDALDLCNKLLKIKQYHTTEQLSFSVILTKEKKLKNASGAIFHYWPKDYKIQMNNFLSAIFIDCHPRDIGKLLLMAGNQRILRTTLTSKIIYNFHPLRISNFFNKKLPGIFKRR